MIGREECQTFCANAGRGSPQLTARLRTSCTSGMRAMSGTSSGIDRILRPGISTARTVSMDMSPLLPALQENPSREYQEAPGQQDLEKGGDAGNRAGCRGLD